QARRPCQCLGARRLDGDPEPERGDRAPGDVLRRDHGDSCRLRHLRSRQLQPQHLRQSRDTLWHHPLWHLRPVKDVHAQEEAEEAREARALPDDHRARDPDTTILACSLATVFCTAPSRAAPCYYSTFKRAVIT